MIAFSNNHHVSYFEVNRHWSPGSEKYAGGDALLTALRHGWDLQSTVYMEQFWHSGTRPVTIYHFELSHGKEVMTMPVISNPHVRRMIREMKPEVRPLAEREAERRKQRQMEDR